MDNNDWSPTMEGFIEGLPYIPEISTSDIMSDDSSMLLYLQCLEEEQQDTASSSKKIIPRDRDAAHRKLMQDYFDENSRFGDQLFRRRYRISKTLFLKLVSDVVQNYEWFQEGYDGRFKKSFSAIQKISSAIRQLATGNTPDEYDEYLCMSERTNRECLEYFCDAVVEIYKNEFLRRPTSHDVALLFQAHEDRHHLPGMLGSIDCTHFVWRLCPKELRGQYKRGDHEHPTVMLEAVASNDLWFWHAFCGVPGANNDINVLQQSPLFQAERDGTAPKCPFIVNGRQYKRGYYLTDGIYPSWSTFVKAFTYPVDVNQKKFKKVQESARKDVERSFGVLKAKWGILRRPMRFKTINRLRKVVYTCMILHNMILKDDGNAISPVHIRDPPVQPTIDANVLPELEDDEKHFQLRLDLMEHISTIDLPHLDLDDD